MAYLLDTNFFIEAHRSIYPIDVMPSFWKKVNELAFDNRIISIDKVRDEMFKHNDNLTNWCSSELPDSFFYDCSSCIGRYAEVSKWAVSMNSHYHSRAITEFLDVGEADAWLVSYALHHKLTIVTKETSDPLRKNRIKIPEPCNVFGVPYINTIEMFRQLGVTI